MPVSLDGNALHPAPFVSVNKSFNKTGEGRVLSANYQITLTGHLVADMGSPSSGGAFGGDIREVIPDSDDWYDSLQNKQLALRDLISNAAEGAELLITAPNAAANFSFIVMPQSLDFPSHDPGDPKKSEYTIVLTAENLGVYDNDNFNQMVTQATEAWDIQEADQYSYDRDGLYGVSHQDPDPEGTSPEDSSSLSRAYLKANAGSIKAVKKSWVITRTCSATGKPIFEAPGVYAAGGMGWEQARSYIVNMGYGLSNLTRGNPANRMDKNSVNIPASYVPYNYKRLASFDPLAATYTTIESWQLIEGEDNPVVESLDVSVSKGATSNAIVTLNGVVQGLLDNAKNIQDAQVALSDKDVTKRWENAQAHYNEISDTLMMTARHMILELDEFKGANIKLVPLAQTKTVGQQPGAGTITYSINFEIKPNAAIPFAMDDSIIVNDTYPGHVNASHTVLGRKIGPVLQSIGTQTVWQRDLTLTMNVDVTVEKVCIDNNGNKLEGANSTAKCQAAATAIGTHDPPGNPALYVHNPNYVDIEAELDGGQPYSNSFILAKPGSAQIAGVTVNPYTTKTSALYQRWEQAYRIKQIIDSFDPITYLITVDHTQTSGTSGYPNRVRKRFMNPPQESWNPRTGEWSFSITWIYEINDPWAFPSWTYVDPNTEDQDDKLDHPYPGQLF